MNIILIVFLGFSAPLYDRIKRVFDQMDGYIRLTEFIICGILANLMHQKIWQNIYNQGQGALSIIYKLYINLQ